MVNSYDDMMGSASDPADHPATDMPQATQHYAGDVLPIPGDRSMGTGQTGSAATYATGKERDPKVLSIGMPTLKSWAGRQTK